MAIRSFFPPGTSTWKPTAEIKIIPFPTKTTVRENPDILETPVKSIPVEINGITTGSYVQVIGTGGTGLRLRSEPGSTAQTDSITTENEIFLVVDGPIIVDGYTWWKLEGTYQSDRIGWAAAEYLTPIITPTPG
jgi:hypothetical protein